MIQAREIMTEEVICVRKDTPVIEAIELMASRHITGIPVVEEDMTLVGILTEQDILRLFHTFDEEKNRKVEQFMTQPAVHFAVNEPLMDICFCLRDNDIRRVPVTSEGKVVGVISRSDIIQYILQQSRLACDAAGK
ncbi:MAG: CBS domain-containing protein [Planctomycetota bacterium]|jgi:CBS domain-containing protein